MKNQKPIITALPEAMTNPTKDGTVKPEQHKNLKTGDVILVPSASMATPSQRSRMLTSLFGGFVITATIVNSEDDEVVAVFECVYDSTGKPTTHALHSPSPNGPFCFVEQTLELIVERANNAGYRVSLEELTFLRDQLPSTL